MSPELREDSRPQILDDAICLLKNERFQFGAIQLIAEVDRDALLASVESMKNARRITPEWGTPASGVISAAGTLDLDYARTKVGKYQSRVRCRHAMAEFDHSDATEGFSDFVDHILPRLNFTKLL